MVNRRVSEMKRFGFIARKDCFAVSLLIMEWAWVAPGSMMGGTWSLHERPDERETVCGAPVTKHRSHPVRRRQAHGPGAGKVQRGHLVWIEHGCRKASTRPADSPR